VETHFDVVSLPSGAEDDGMRFMLLVMFVGLMSGPVLGQTKSDPQTLQQILEELRAIHRDVRANSTMQLLLAESQLAQTSLDRATQRRDALRSEITRLQGDEKAAQAEIDRTQDTAEKPLLDSTQKAQLMDKLDHLKDGLTRITGTEHADAEELQDAEARVRAAQTEVDTIGRQLSQLVKKLSPVE
jgi:chromosome segregation ATPase